MKSVKLAKSFGTKGGDDMALITATGKIGGKSVVVRCSLKDGEIRATFNGQDNPVYNHLFRLELEKEHPIAGTYYPGINTMLNAYEVLQAWFFDEPPKMDVDGELEPIPYQSNVVF